MYSDLLQLGDVAESDGLAQKSQHFGTSRTAERTVLVVWACAIPGPEAGGFGCWLVTWGIMYVGKGHQVGGEGCFVGLLETGESEWARLKKAG